MEPQQPVQTPSVNPSPTPQPAPVAAPQPNPAPPQPAAPQPSPAPATLAQPVAPITQPMPTTGQSGIGAIDFEKQKKRALWLGIASLVVFVLGLLFGFAALLGAILGAIGFRTSKPLNYKAGVTLGLVGFVLNLGWFLIAVIAG